LCSCLLSGRRRKKHSGKKRKPGVRDSLISRGGGGKGNGGETATSAGEKGHQKRGIFHLVISQAALKGKREEAFTNVKPKGRGEAKKKKPFIPYSRARQKRGRVGNISAPPGRKGKGGEGKENQERIFLALEKKRIRHLFLGFLTCEQKGRQSGEES